MAQPLLMDDEDGALPTLNTVRESDDDLVAGFFEALDNDNSITVTISRLPRPGQTGKAFCFSCGVNDYSMPELLTKIQQDYGPGDYIVSASQRGRRGFLRQVRIIIDKGPDALRLPAPVQKETGGEMRALVDMISTSMRQQTEAFAGMMAQVVQRLDKPAADPEAQMEKTLRLIASMKETFAPPTAPVAPSSGLGIGSAIGQIKELMELRDFVRGDKDPDEKSTADVMMEMAEKFLPPLASMAMQHAPAGQPALQAPPTATASPKPAAPREHSPEEKTAMLEMLSQLKVLVNAAQRESDPEAYAVMVYDQFSNEQLEQFLGDPAALDNLAKFNSGVKLHREWFEKLRLILLGWIAEDAVGSDDTETTDDLGTPGNSAGTDGDAGNLGGDVPPSPRE